MLKRTDNQMASIPADFQPTMVIVVDTEEEFDWSAGYSRDNTKTETIGEQWRAQEIYARYDIRPTYVINHCVAAQEKPAAIMQALYSQGLCDIGMHLHPWVNPPYEEELNAFNSYHGNLPVALERAKMAATLEKVTAVRGSPPKVFKAGRYGVGQNTAALLNEFDFEVDCSVVPFTDMGEDGGPNFKGLPDQPYWFQDGQLLEVPTSKAYFGKARNVTFLRALIEKDFVKQIKLRAALSRLNIINQAPLTPEAVPNSELVSLLTEKIGDGQKIFNMAYHSSSIGINGSPFVTSEQERRDFLARIDMILDVFVNQLGGRIITIYELYNELITLKDQSGQSGAKAQETGQ